MTRRVVVGDLRVQRIDRKDGRRSWTIVWPEGRVHEEADRFLRVHDGSGTQRTYAYYLVDHLRWLERECLDLGQVGLRDLQRYMGIVGADVHMPLGEPWRAGMRPYGRAALSAAAACLKGFYLHQASLGVNEELGEKLDRTRLPTRADRRRSLLGHVKTSMPSNPLTPKGPHRRHPKMLPEGTRESLLGVASSARDRLVVTWLADGGLRVGELCGLHLADLHLRENCAGVGRCVSRQSQRFVQARVPGPVRPLDRPHGERRHQPAREQLDGSDLVVEHVGQVRGVVRERPHARRADEHQLVQRAAGAAGQEAPVQAHRCEQALGLEPALLAKAVPSPAFLEHEHVEPWHLSHEFWQQVDALAVFEVERRYP
jgi:hypothetical protein